MILFSEVLPLSLDSSKSIAAITAAESFHKVAAMPLPLAFQNSDSNLELKIRSDSFYLKKFNLPNDLVVSNGTIIFYNDKTWQF